MSDQSKRRIRFVALLVTPFVMLVAITAGGWWWGKHEMTRRRSQWKEAAIAQLAGMSSADKEIRRELDQLRTSPDSLHSLRWTHDHVLLMANGEHVLYAYWHTPYTGFADDLFLGRDSDGRWLYSTYHFCDEMFMVRWCPPPRSIEEFKKQYFVREFDGHSDTRLEHTWPPRK